MAQSKAGALKTAKTNKRKHGRDYYKRIGALGGKAGRTGGFYHMMINNHERLKQISSDAAKLQKRGQAIEGM